MNLSLQRAAVSFADYNDIAPYEAYAILSSIGYERVEDD